MNNRGYTVTELIITIVAGTVMLIMAGGILFVLYALGTLLLSFAGS